jgi:hypothetical protein
VYPPAALPLSGLFPQIEKKKRPRSPRRPAQPAPKTGIHGFFENMVETINHPVKQPLPKVRSAARAPVYDPRLPLITSDIYVAKPLKFKSTLETVVEQVRANLSQLSGLYRGTIAYKKPKLLPLLPVPEFKGGQFRRNAKNKNLLDIEDDELIDFTGAYVPPPPPASQPRPAKAQARDPKASLDLEPAGKPPEESARPKMDLSNAYRELRMAVEFVKFSNYCFRLYSHQIRAMHAPTTDFLRQAYERTLEEASAATFEMCRSQLLRVWQAIFSDPNLNVVLNQQVLLAYGVVEEEDARKPYSAAEKQRYLESCQTYCTIVHVPAADQKLLMDLLSQLLSEVSVERLSADSITLLKLLCQSKTYFADDMLTTSEASRIRFRKSGLPANYSKNHQKMLLAGIFIFKTFLPRSFCQPEQHLSEFSVSNLARLYVASR